MKNEVSKPRISGSSARCILVSHYSAYQHKTKGRKIVRTGYRGSIRIEYTPNLKFKDLQGEEQKVFFRS
jgi:hypothetical protein